MTHPAAEDQVAALRKEIRRAGRPPWPVATIAMIGGIIATNALSDAGASFLVGFASFVMRPVFRLGETFLLVSALRACGCMSRMLERRSIGAAA